ncbi:MAG: hypothetical protein IT320_24010 [Anaerolineae bacterium]|nr:hypothetical protein [Anaerolineae bacterium]
MRPRWFLLGVMAALAVSGCSVFPGLRVLTGEGGGSSQAERTVQNIDLVMGDKSGDTDSSLLNAAYRIEAADNLVDIIEIREDIEAHIFDVTMLFLASPQNTPQGQRDWADALRQAVELTWRAVIPESENSDVLRITFVAPAEINTLDNGPSFVGIVDRSFEIGRLDAVNYLQGNRSLETFLDLLAEGKMQDVQPDSLEFYTGTPNHPMFVAPPDEAG